MIKHVISTGANLQAPQLKYMFQGNNSDTTLTILHKKFFPGETHASMNQQTNVYTISDTLLYRVTTVTIIPWGKERA